MGKSYRIEPNTTSYYEEIEADTPEEALVKFAEQMDLDMSAYFRAVQKPEKTELEKVLDIFRNNAAYDENDEAIFKSNNPVFKARMEKLIKEKNSFDHVIEWEAHVQVSVTEALILCQYGDITDADSLEKMKKSLKERGLSGRYGI